VPSGRTLLVICGIYIYGDIEPEGHAAGPGHFDTEIAQSPAIECVEMTRCDVACSIRSRLFDTAWRRPRPRPVYNPGVSTSRAEYVQRINRTMDFIDTHLAEPLPLERLAGVAAFSKYHFHRIFYAQVGETPGQYVQRLRIEKAAMLVLAHRDRTITDIAYSVGFSDVAAFSRAFRQAHGMSASKFRAERTFGAGDSNPGTENSNPGIRDRKMRKEGTADGGYDTGIPTDSRRNTMPELITEPFPAQSVTVSQKPEMTVAYVRHTGPYFGDEQLFQRLFTALYKWAAPRNLIKRGVTEEIVIYHDDPDTVAPEKLRISCGISVPAETEVSGEVGKLTLPAGLYAEARFVVDATQFGGARNWVYGVWLPESGYQPDDRQCYEKYIDTDPEAEMSDELGRTFTVDICIPVKPL
jgi:AraC family transcriptional regulator